MYNSDNKFSKMVIFMKIYNTPEELIGKTPLLRLEKTEKIHGVKAKLLAKLELFNPTGSAKDRAAKYMLNEAVRSGAVKDDTVIIEPTSGNTGIGLASLAAANGYRAIIVMPSNMSRERIRLMKAYGAEVILTDASLGMKGAIAKADELAREMGNAFIPSQFDNPENTRAHRETTGPEIYADTDGEVDIIVAGVGTGGTISGIGEYIKSKNPNVKIVAVEPKDSPYLSAGISGVHKLQGIGAGFVPKILNLDVIDEIIPIDTESAYRAARELGSKIGILVGISSGAALAAAIEVGKRCENAGKNIVVICPDGGERYLSSDLYEE